MPVLGGAGPALVSSGAGITRRGVIVPDGSLDRWAEASTVAASALFEVSVIGDSTTYGASQGGSADPWYTWVRRLRQKSIAAGLPSGGYGLHHPGDVAQGEFDTESGGYPRITARTGWAQLGFGAIFSLCSTSPGDTVTLEGQGTAFRLMTYRSSAGHGSLSYSVDGGDPVSVNLQQAITGIAYVNVPVYVGGLTSGVHSVTVVNTSTGSLRSEFNIEWLGSAGVVYHRDALSGTSSGTWSDSVTAEAKSLSDTPVRLGLRGVTNNATTGGNTVNGYAWGATVGPKPQYRDVRLTIVQIGTNDVNAASSSDSADQRAETYLENVALLVRTARAAGSDVLLVSPPYTASVHPQGQRQHGRMKCAALDVAMSHGCAYADFQEALGWDVAAWSSHGYGPGTVSNPHLPRAAYEREAEWLWDEVLAQ